VQSRQCQQHRGITTTTSTTTTITAPYRDCGVTTTTTSIPQSVCRYVFDATQVLPEYCTTGVKCIWWDGVPYCNVPDLLDLCSLPCQAPTTTTTLRIACDSLNCQTTCLTINGESWVKYSEVADGTCHVNGNFGYCVGCPGNLCTRSCLYPQ